jgi:hypothetical protein
MLESNSRARPYATQPERSERRRASETDEVKVREEESDERLSGNVLARPPDCCGPDFSRRWLQAPFTRPGREANETETALLFFVGNDLGDTGLLVYSV